MKTRASYFKRSFAVLMAVMMVFTMIPTMAFAGIADANGNANAAAVQNAGETNSRLDAAKAELETLAATWNLSTLKEDLQFPDETSNGCEVVWKSNQTRYLSNTGAVVRIAPGGGDVKGKLTATIYDKADSAQVEFDFTVKEIQVSELEAPAKATLEGYIDELTKQELVYGDFTLFEGENLNCNPTSSNYSKGIIMPVNLGGRDTSSYVTVESDNKDAVNSITYSGSSWGKNGKIDFGVVRTAEEQTATLTFTIKFTSTSDPVVVQKTIKIAANASDAEKANLKNAAEKAFADIEKYDGSNLDALRKEVEAAKSAIEAAFKSGWNHDEIATWKNYGNLAVAEEILENRDYTVTLTIQGFNMGDLYPNGDGSEVAYFVKAQPLTVKAGWSVYDVLDAAAKHYDFSIGGSPSYVTSIAGLSEKMLGSYSGWMYQVNTTDYINQSIGAYKISDGDNILIYYVLSYGSNPACSFDEIRDWAKNKENVSLLDTDYKAILEEDWEVIEKNLDANTVWFGDLPMPARGKNNSRVVWESSNTDVVGTDGTVNKAKEATTVKLTATLYAGNEKLVKTYDVKIGGSEGINVTVKIEGPDASSSLEPWTGTVQGGDLTKYDSTVKYNGYGDYIMPAHALMTCLQASDPDFKFNNNAGLKTNSGNYESATIKRLFNVGSSNGKMWRLQVISKDGSVRFESISNSELYFNSEAKLADGDTVVFRYTAKLSDLTNVITQAESLQAGNYTEESFAAVKTALEKAKAVEKNGFYAQQDAIDAAKAELDTAINGLVISVDLTSKLPIMLKTLAEKDTWQSLNAAGYGVLALARADMSMCETGYDKFVNSANSNLKSTATNRPMENHMMAAIGMTALGYDLNYYTPKGGKNTASAQMWQTGFGDGTVTEPIYLSNWLLLNRAGAYPTETSDDRTNVEKTLIAGYDETLGGWAYYGTVNFQNTVFSVMALSEAYYDEKNVNHEEAVKVVNGATSWLKSQYTAKTSLSYRAYIAMALMSVGMNPEDVKVDNVGIITSFAKNVLADYSGFSDTLYGSNYSSTNSLYTLVIQMYKEFRETGKPVNLNVNDSYPAEAKVALSAELDAAKSLSAEDYTDASYLPLAEAVSKAEEVIISINSTEQQIAECTEALKEAKKGLALVKDTSALEAVIAEAKKIDLDAQKYTQETKTTLEDAIKQAEAVLVSENPSQSSINGAVEILRSAIDGLLIEGEAEIAEIIKKIANDWIAKRDELSDDWQVVDMAMLGRADELFKDEAAMHSYVSKSINKINARSVTDYERVLLAVTALGIDGSKLDEYRTFYDKNGNVVKSLVDAIQAFPKSEMSINGATFALLAFDSGEYEVGNGDWSRENLVAYLLQNQLADGGWNLQSEGDSDVDVTAMAVSALAPYGARADVKTALEKAMNFLSEAQDKVGKFGSYGTTNSNSSSMAVIAAAATGKDADADQLFVKWSKGEQHSALEGLLAFKTSNGKFGYEDNRSVNVLSTEQAFRALVTYRNFIYAGSDKAVHAYAFGKPDATEKWDEEAVASKLEITKMPAKTEYKVGEKFDSTGLAVTVTFTDDTVIEPAVTDLQISGFDTTTSGTRTVKVQYQNAYDTFVITVANDESAPTTGKVYLRVADPKGKTYLAKTAFDFEAGETAFSILGKSGVSYRPNWGTKYDGVYVEAIEGLGEFDEGAQSGWMYRVNGVYPMYSASLHELREGDYVEWLYTRDLGKDLGNFYVPGFDEGVNQDPSDDAANNGAADEDAAKLEQVKELTGKLSVSARSSKTADKNTKVVLKMDAQSKAAIKEMKELGFIVKYRFYRSTKKASGYKAMLTKSGTTYTNTVGKSGTKYYYKVQVRVYDENGKLVAKSALKQCKYACRMWTK